MNYIWTRQDAVNYLRGYWEKKIEDSIFDALTNGAKKPLPMPPAKPMPKPGKRGC